MNKVWGYARVSTKEQNLDRQIHAIREYHPDIKYEDIYQDKKSGKNFDREAYIALKKVLRDGDILIIKDAERLGRHKELVKEELRWMKEHGIRVKILSIPTTLIDLEENDWVMDMVGTILIEVYTSLAEQDYNDRRLKAKEGIAIAKANGKFKGRKPVQIDKRKFESIYNRWKKGELKGTEAIDLLKLTRPTFYKKVKEYEEGNADKWLK